MSDKELSEKLLALLGGKENVTANAACMTRLRVTVRDLDKVDVAGIKALDGVMGVVEDETMQVILGPGKVNKVLEEFSKLTGLAKGVAEESVTDAAAENKAAQKAKYEHKPVQAFMKKIANIFVALLPGIIAAGLINGICNVINVASGNMFAEAWWYQGIRSMGWALFAYLPILVGYNAAREFGGSASLGGIAGMMCIANAAMPLLAAGAADPDKAILLPLTNAAYNPAAGGMIAALIAGAFFAFLEKQIRKVMPNIVDTFLTPLCVLVIGAFALMLVIQPLGAWLTTGIFAVLSFVYEKMGIVGGYILAAGFLPLVSVGLHQALTPIHALLNDPNGATHGINYLLPILMMAGGGQVGAGLALYLKTKNKKLRKFIGDSIPVGILGIGEPLMYAVTLPLVKPFVTACLGAGFGGILAALFHIGTVSQGVSGLFGLLIVVPGQQLFYVLAMLAAYAGGFVLTWFFGVDEQRINEFYGE
ncbi:MAG: PTS transporter subunit EIIC [Olsenella sp.]|jgi:PTS system sucrose-specific IIC component|nr:PTS transporter subunit EIIC [Olsenella sp.]MCI1667479.1 PTS transporter subunit EIIC [Olsenella sp.]MCI1879214.1 PTS transporter subunit EIIC [Olsenella sp.]MCI2123582.1 PTS transporter subunit EIIC [Olsenella sp.]MCI2127323.1 PTS transporter subunit EIIC [Olsenella sp.]